MARILLVDDDEDLNALNRHALEKRGHQVDVAYTASEAAQTLRGAAPDLAVIDVMLETPQSGFDLVRSLEQLAPDTPAMLLSGMKEAGYFEFKPNETWLPVVAYMDKPVTPAVLADKVEAYFNGRIH